MIVEMRLLASKLSVMRSPEAKTTEPILAIITPEFLTSGAKRAM